MTSRQSNLQEDTYFRVMGILQDNPNLTQRELADKLGLSLGGLNYCLRALIDKGFVKMQNFNKAENKLKFVYLLTPRGILEKSSLTYRFLERKLHEYAALKVEIEALKGQIDLSASAKAKILHLD
jgi:EPS-associated MarR family transcriptional regulator